MNPTWTRPALRFALLAGFAALALIVLTPSSSATPMKTITSLGPLDQIDYGDELSCQTSHVIDGGTLEIYPPGTRPGDCGSFLALGGTLYAPNFGAHGVTATGWITTYTPFTPVSQTAVSGSGTPALPFQVTTVAKAGVVRITETNFYVVGDSFFDTTTTLRNTGSTPQPYVFYRAIDCYLGQSDVGYGALNLVRTGAVACTKNANDVPPGRWENLEPRTAGSRYYEDFYGNVWTWIDGKTSFPNTCTCTASLDNGIGLSWSGTLAPGASVTYNSTLRFNVVPDSPACEPPAIGVYPDCKLPCAPPGLGFEPNCSCRATLPPTSCRPCLPPQYGLQPDCYTPCPPPSFGILGFCHEPCQPPAIGFQPQCHSPCKPPAVGLEPRCRDGCYIPTSPGCPHPPCSGPSPPPECTDPCSQPGTPPPECQQCNVYAPDCNPCTGQYGPTPPNCPEVCRNAAHRPWYCSRCDEPSPPSECMTCGGPTPPPECTDPCNYPNPPSGCTDPCSKPNPPSFCGPCSRPNPPVSCSVPCSPANPPPACAPAPAMAPTAAAPDPPATPARIVALLRLAMPVSGFAAAS